MRTLLVEATLKQLRDQTDSNTVSRSKKIVSYYQGVNKAGTVIFKTTSQSTPGHFWKQRVKLLDLPFWLSVKDKDLTMIKKVRMAIKGDIKVWCNGKAFKYWGWAYITTQQNAKWGSPESRFPKVRNPNLNGSVCKHLENVLRVLPFYASDIVRDLGK